MIFCDERIPCDNIVWCVIIFNHTLPPPRHNLRNLTHSGVPMKFFPIFKNSKPRAAIEIN